MSPFHSGMNHWQRQWLSDRLHKKHEPAPPVAPVPLAAEGPKRRKASRPKTKPPESQIVERIWNHQRGQV